MSRVAVTKYLAKDSRVLRMMEMLIRTMFVWLTVADGAFNTLNNIIVAALVEKKALNLVCLPSRVCSCTGKPRRRGAGSMVNILLYR